jgi:hypothetical protein
VLYTPLELGPASSEINRDGNGHHWHPNLLALRKALEYGCSICSIVMDNIRVDALKQGKLKWGHETDLISDADLSDPGTSLDFTLYREELSSNNVMTIKLDVTIWGSNLSSISRFRLLSDSGEW